MEQDIIYCPSCNNYDTAYEFLEAFYALKNRNTYYQGGKLQCGNANRSLTDLLKLCEYHVKNKVTIRDIVEFAIDKFYTGINYPGYYHSDIRYPQFLYCTDIDEVVLDPFWRDGDDEEGLVNDGTYGIDRFGDRKGEGTYSLIDIKNLIDELQGT